MVKRSEGRLDLNFQDTACFDLFFSMLQKEFQVEMPSDPTVRLLLEQQGGINYDQWRVAILNFESELLPDALTTVQRHDETDEVFVLLGGKCILFIGEGQETITALHAEDMAPQNIY